MSIEMTEAPQADEGNEMEMASTSICRILDAILGILSRFSGGWKLESNSDPSDFYLDR